MSSTHRWWRGAAGIMVAAVLTAASLGPVHAAPHTAVAAKTTLIFWSHDNPDWIAAYNALIARFEKAHPDIVIKYQKFPYQGLLAKLGTTLGTSAAPDVADPFGTWVTGYARAGKLDPVPSSVATTKQIQSTYFPAAIGASFYNGKYYALPHEYNLENDGILVDPVAFKQAGIGHYPRTWSELKADAARLTVRKGNTIKRAGFLFTSDDNITFLFLALILQQGADYWASDKVHVNLTTPAAVRAMQEEKSFIQAKVESERDFPTGATLDIFDYFFRHQAAMVYRGPWVIGTGQATYKGAKFAYVPAPSFTNRPPYFAAESGWSDIVSATSKRKAEAWAFVKFINSKDNDRLWNITTYTVPSRKDLVDDLTFVRARPLMKPVFGYLGYGRWVGPVQDRDRFWASIHRYASKIFRNEISVQDGLKKAQDEINTMIDQQLGAGQ